jgi:hypothetical protein
MNDYESPREKAIRLLQRQLDELQTIRIMNPKRAEFKAWHDTTVEVLQRFLGSDSQHTTRFHRTSFSGGLRIRPFGSRPLPPDYVSKEDMLMFRKGCEEAEATLKAAVRTIEDFGVHVEQPGPAPARRGRGGNGGGVTQTFNAPVTIHSQAIATDKAIQNIGQMGDRTVGSSLNEIAQLLQQSEELSPRQVKEGLAHIEAVAIEEQKPEPKRNWGVLLERGGAILGLIDKATDLGHKLSEHTPSIVALVEQAKHFIK